MQRAGSGSESFVIVQGSSGNKTVIVVVSVLAAVVALVVISLLAVAIIKRKALCNTDAGKAEQPQQQYDEGGYYGTASYDSCAGSYAGQAKVS